MPSRKTGKFGKHNEQGPTPIVDPISILDDLEAAQTNLARAHEKLSVSIKDSSARLTVPDMIRLAHFLIRLRKAAKKFLAPSGRSDSAWHLALALYTRQDSPPCKIAELAAQTNQPNPTVLRSLSSLEDHGFIELKDDPNDKRVTTVKLTKLGLDRVKECFVAAHSHHSNNFS